MSPRTNDSAPEPGHDARPDAEPPGGCCESPALRAAETRPEEAARDAWERVFASGGPDTSDERQPSEAQRPGDDRSTTVRAGADDGDSAGTPEGGPARGDAPAVEPSPEQNGHTGAGGEAQSARAGGESEHADADGGAEPVVRSAGGDHVVRVVVPDGEPSGDTVGASVPEAAGTATPSEPVGTVDPRAAATAGSPRSADAAEADGVRAAATASPEPERDARVLPVTDERVAALRRFSASGRRWHAVRVGVCAASLAIALTAGATVIGALRDRGTAPVASAPSGVSPQLLASGDLDSSIRALQAHLRAQPKDYGSWATLGLAYVEQARTKGDPSRYPQAQSALERSLQVRPDNDAALAGRAALAAARHDFADALTYADQALKQNPYSERALSSRIDALVELGRYDDASKAADLADSRRPGIPVFTRYAYVHELRGDVTTARRVLEQALSTATSRGDIAYVAGALGDLVWNQGDYKGALSYYARALAADDSYLPALEGRARAQAAQGDTAEAIRGMEQVVDRYPLPKPLVELGELYETRGKAGDRDKARDQYALVEAWVSLARANGVNADLDTALAAADHGDRAAALKAARAEWARRHTVHTADALAWALHVNGLDQEALPYAQQATATGYRNASFLYHRGMIERATGHTDRARASLTAALDLNSGFSPLGAREARKALEAMK